jgi:outer membrane lipoprotein-sorting protein
MTFVRTLVVLAALAAPAWALTGREVIDNAQKKNGLSTWKDRVTTATMKTYNGGSLSRTRELDIVEQTDPRGEHRTFMSFTGPADVQGTRFLHISPRGTGDQQWLYAPVTRRVRRLADAQRDENFFGADLSYRDLELLVRIQQWNDGESTATLDHDETFDGKPCHVVTLVPKNDEFIYTKYVLWFGTDDELLWRVDVYDADQKLYKRMTPRKYERIGGYATAMESEVATLTADTHTEFLFKDVKYDRGVDETTFAVSNLDHG